MADGVGLDLPLLVHAGAAATYARERLARIAVLHEQERLRRDGISAMAASAAFLELLVWLCQLAEASPHGERGGAAAERAAVLVREHPEQAWTTLAIARRVGVSAPWLAISFRQRFAMTVARFLLGALGSRR